MRKRDNKTAPNRILSFPAENEFVMSRLDAERALKRDGYPSIYQIIDRARTKVDWPDTVWVELEAVVNQSRNASLRKGNDDIEKRTTILTRFWRNHRRLAMVCSIILIIGTTVAVVPESRAFAMQVCEAVIRIFGNRAEVQQAEQAHIEREYDNQIAEHFASTLEYSSSQEHEMQTFEDLKEFEKTTGYLPFALDASIFVCETIEYLTMDGESQLNIHYAYADGHVYTTQIWNMAYDIEALANDTYNKHITESGRTVHYSIDKLDGSIYGITILEGSVLIISADNMTPLEIYLNAFET